MIVKTRNMIAVNVDASAVHMARTNARGIIKAVASANWVEPVQLPLRPEDDATFVKTATATLRDCRKKGCIGTGGCVLVLGGPNVTLRHFVWPLMGSEESLYENAQNEIASYLSNPVESYIVDYKVLRVLENGTQEVLVAAVSKSLVTNVIVACKNAGLKVLCVDLRENVREKLARAGFIWSNGKTGMESFDANSSYAMIDVGPVSSNITVFTDGLFSMNRYISSSNLKLEDLVSEIGGVVSYASYSERRSPVSSLIILRDDFPSVSKLAARLTEDLDVPVYLASRDISEFFRPDLRLSAPVSPYIDVFAGTLYAPANKRKDLNLIPRKKKRHIFGHFVLPALLCILVFAAALKAGLYLPEQWHQQLTAQSAALDAQLAGTDMSQMDIVALRQHVDRQNLIMAEHSQFVYESYDIPAILSEIKAKLPPDTNISTLTCNKGIIRISGRTAHAGHVAELEKALRGVGMFQSVGVETIQSMTERVQGDSAEPELAAVVMFMIAIELNSNQEEAVQ